MLESPLALSEDRLGLSFQAAFKNRIPEIRSIGFYPRFHKNQGKFAQTGRCPQNHHRPGFLETLNSSYPLWNGFEDSCTNPIILSVQLFFDDEQLLIRKHDAFHVAKIVPLKQRFRSFESGPPLLHRQAMNSTPFIRRKSQVFFEDPLDGCTRNPHLGRQSSL